MKLIHPILLAAIVLALSIVPISAQGVGSIGGQVTDALGAVVVGATVTAVSADGKERQAITNARGEYSITGLAPGKYTVKGIAKNFGLYENADVTVATGDRSDLIIVLTVAELEENVDVSTDNQVNNDADNNQSATVIKGKDLDALPDDPDELSQALQALAGPSSGPGGGQIYIDGFTGGEMPSKDSIREIRINQSPFSAEFDRMGFGRIEILTKPGSDKFRGSVNGRFNDESLNSRNPFALNRASTQSKNFGGNISGPVQKGRSSFFLDLNMNNNDENAIVNAQILDPSLNIVNFTQDYGVPTKRYSIGPRFDYTINDRNTLVARYRFDKSTSENQGLGSTSLASRAYDSERIGHEVRLTETMIINAKTVNETRFQYRYNNSNQNGDNTIPTINVSSAFTGGGAQIGQSFSKTKSWELNNYTTTSFGKNSQHSVKFGAQLENDDVVNRSENGFGGTFLFTGFTGSDPADLNGDGVVSPIEQYRAKVSGLVGTQYNPTQFSITAGNPVASVKQFQAGLFVNDDWRVSPALLLSFGLRYENQTNIHSNLNFAPRFGYAWSPGAGGAKTPKTVFRGGIGVFYDRFSDSYTLQANRFDGVSQLNLLVSANETDPVRRAAALVLLGQPVFTLNGVTNVPSAADILANIPGTSTIRQVSSDLQAPYTIQSTFGVERQLPTSMKTTLTAYFVTARSLHQLRTRNINAPICPLQVNCLNAPRPDPTLGNVNQYDSSGTIDQKQLIVNFRSNFSQRFSVSGNYRLNFVKGDTDGAGSSPAYAYDFTGEYGRASSDVRHNFFLFGNVTLPWSLSLNPFVIISSGSPFNITTGQDLNGDGVLNERPTYGALQSRCSELGLTNSFCDIGSNDPSSILPRNYGTGPGSVLVNLRVSKNFGFGSSGTDKSGSGGHGGPGMMGGGFGGGRFGGFGGETRKPYNLNVGISFNNILNHPNFASPVSTLSSSRFGQTVSTGGGFGRFGGGGDGPIRRIELNMRFSW